MTRQIVLITILFLALIAVILWDATQGGVPYSGTTIDTGYKRVFINGNKTVYRFVDSGRDCYIADKPWVPLTIYCTE